MSSLPAGHAEGFHHAFKALFGLSQSVIGDDYDCIEALERALEAAPGRSKGGALGR